MSVHRENKLDKESLQREIIKLFNLLEISISLKRAGLQKKMARNFIKKIINKIRLGKTKKRIYIIEDDFLELRIIQIINDCDNIDDLDYIEDKISSYKRIFLKDRLSSGSPSSAASSSAISC